MPPLQSAEYYPVRNRISVRKECRLGPVYKEINASWTEAGLSRGDLSDAEWRLLEPLLPAECGRKSIPAVDNRQIVKGILWCIRTGAPWRDLPDKYGKWITVYQRFRRWSYAWISEGVATTLAQ